jgi:hypothetical protein
MKKAITLGLSILFLTNLNAQTTASSEMDKAESYFRNSSVVTFNEDYNPKDYIGSLIYYKPGDEKNIRILKITKPNDSTIIRTVMDDILYQKMHTREEVASAKFLGIFSTKVTNQHLLEVILLRDYSLEAQSFLTDLVLYEQVLKFSKPLKNAGYNVEFVWKVNVNKLTSRVFKEGNVQVGFNYQVEGSGKIYNKTEDFTKKNLTTLQTIDVTIFMSEATKSIESVMKGNKSNLKTEKDILKFTKPKDYILAEKIVFEEIKE